VVAKLACRTPPTTQQARRKHLLRRKGAAHQANRETRAHTLPQNIKLRKHAIAWLRTRSGHIGGMKLGSRGCGPACCTCAAGAFGRALSRTACCSINALPLSDSWFTRRARKALRWARLVTYAGARVKQNENLENARRGWRVTAPLHAPGARKEEGGSHMRSTMYAARAPRALVRRLNTCLASPRVSLPPRHFHCAAMPLHTHRRTQDAHGWCGHSPHTYTRRRRHSLLKQRARAHPQNRRGETARTSCVLHLFAAPFPCLRRKNTHAHRRALHTARAPSRGTMECRFSAPRRRDFSAKHLRGCGKYSRVAAGGRMLLVNRDINSDGAHAALARTGHCALQYKH